MFDCGEQEVPIWIRPSLIQTSGSVNCLQILLPENLDGYFEAETCLRETAEMLAEGLEDRLSDSEDAYEGKHCASV